MSDNIKVSALKSGDRVRVKWIYDHATREISGFAKATNLRDTENVTVIFVERKPALFSPGLPYRVLVQRHNGGKIVSRFSGYTTMMPARAR